MTAPQVLQETLDVVALRAVPEAAEVAQRGTGEAGVAGRGTGDAEAAGRGTGDAEAAWAARRGTGERSRRRRIRRRLAREQLMVALFLLLALIATVAILGREWLDSASVTTSPDAISTVRTSATNLTGGGR